MATAEDGYYRGFGDAGGFSNVLPGGGYRSASLVGTAADLIGLHSEGVDDQRAMYADLDRAVPGLSESGLRRFFKDASFGVAPTDVGAVYRPTPGVTVVRDRRYGVAHIFGATREATMFAQGYTGAEDRLFLMDVLRHIGRARVSELLGPSPANQAMDRAQLAVAPYTDADLARQVQDLRQRGNEGRAVAEDLAAYALGVNAYITDALLDPAKLPAEYPALQVLPKRWTPEDTVAVASFIGAQLGRGGGAELSNFCGLAELKVELGDAERARAVFDDFHFTDDPEAPTTSSRPWSEPAGRSPIDPASQPAVDCRSLGPIGDGPPSLADLLEAVRGLLPADLTGPFGSFRLNLPERMSNALLVAGDRAAAGRPIAVFGPQTGYFAPQILVEKDVHGPGIDARGIAFPGTDLYVQMGRGPAYAWSATSSGADNVDQVVLRLCDPAGGPATVRSMGYLHDGRCEGIEGYQHVQVAKPTLAGLPAGPDLVLSWPVERTARYGPLLARGRLTDGTPIAVTTNRTTYGGELTSAIGFRRLNDPASMRGGFPSFRRAVAGVDYTFNWFYVDGHDIGYQQSCRCPRRAPGVDPNLPAWGTGRWDWRGFVAPADNPWDLNPASGYLTSWNNRQAPGYPAADDRFSFGPVFRSQLLDRRIEAAMRAGNVDRAALVAAVEDAATVDLRGDRDLPVMLDVLGPVAPPGVDRRAETLRATLAAWTAAGSHRRDVDADGAYDDPLGPAAMDAWWDPAVHAMFDATSGHAIDHLHLTTHDPPQRHLGSAFEDGLYSHVDKDLRRVLGRPVSGPWSRTYCGGGQLSSCRAALWQSLSAAADALEKEFGSSRPADWKRVPADDEVRFTAVGLKALPPLPWVNRPTFQQLVQVGVPPP